MRVVGMLAWVVVAVGAAGCELVFAPHAGSGDAAGAVTSDADPGTAVDADVVALCPGQTLVPHVVTVLADAELSSADPGAPLGVLATAKIDGGPAPSHALFKFDLTETLAYIPVELRLTLHSADRQDTCGGSCGACGAMEQSGWLGAYVAASDWVENQVTWSAKSGGGAGWQGADAPGVDRGVIEVIGDHAAGGTTEFVFSGPAKDEAWGWKDTNFPADRLSFLIKPRDQVVMMSSTHEGTTTACDTGDVTARLTIYTCL